MVYYIMYVQVCEARVELAQRGLNSAIENVCIIKIRVQCHAKPTGEGTRLSPQQFDPSTGHVQPFVPAELVCILYLGCCLNVWWVSD